MRLFFTLIAITICWISSFSQPENNKHIQIKVLTESRSSLPDAIVTLLAQDSSVVKSTAANNSGTVVFDHLPAGNYIIRVRLLGFKNHNSGLLDLVSKKEHFDTVIMMPEQKVLQEVTVTSKKPLIQFFAG